MSSNDNYLQNYNMIGSYGSDFNLMRKYMVNAVALSIEESRENEEDQDDLEAVEIMQP